MVVIKLLLIFCCQFVIVVRCTGLFGFGYGLPRVCFCRCGVSRGYAGNTPIGRYPKEPSVQPHEYPWLAAINIGSQVVAGSLISDRHVLTAASPVYGSTSERIIVSLGAHDRCAIGGSTLNVSVESTIIHPGYSQTNLENDLALIKLKHAVTFSQYISPVCLPVFGVQISTEQITWTVGWKQSSTSCTPHVAVLPSLSPAICFNDVENKLSSNDKGCLGPLSMKGLLCKGDVGSPVMTRWSSNAAFRLIGVMSTSSCDDTASTPPLFTRITDHIEWIYEYIRRDCSCL